MVYCRMDGKETDSQRDEEHEAEIVDDKRNFLYLHFIRCLMQSKPKIFVAENVKGMMTLGKGEVFKQIIQDFAAAGYTIYHKLLNSAEYGVPQIRERVILVGVRNDIDFEYVHPEATHRIHHSPMKRRRYQMHRKQVTAQISGCQSCLL